MRSWIGIFALALSGCSRDAVLTETDRSRFLYISVLEGLQEDGANRALIKSLLTIPDDHFVSKCPLCWHIQSAFDNYAKGPSMGGAGLPPAIMAELKSPDLITRRAGLEKLVGRYVRRGFNRSKMTDGQKAQMRKLLEEGKKIGMDFAKSGNFGDSCPSCSGATKPAK